MITGRSGSGKTNALLNLITQQDDIDKIYFYAKDLNEPNYEFLIKKHEARFLFNFWHSRLLWIYHQKTRNFGWNPRIQIYPNKIKNGIAFKVKAGYKLELLSPETMKLLVSAKKDVDKNKDGEDVPKLESVEVILVHCNIVNNSYQKASKVLFTFEPNKQFGQLITISPHLLTMLKTTNAEFESIQLFFTDQNNRPLEIENSINITPIIG